MSGSNSFSLTPKQWIQTTNVKGIVSITSRYGGTFAHKDIAYEFASWLSAKFIFYLIKEFQRLKKDGEILCYHIYNRNEFEDYLITNTKIINPSST